MKHIALPSDGMTLTQPPSREIMPRDPVTPRPRYMPSPSTRLDYPLVATLLCDSPYNSTTSVRRQMQSFYLRSNTRRIIEPIEYGTIKYM